MRSADWLEFTSLNGVSFVAKAAVRGIVARNFDNAPDKPPYLSEILLNDEVVYQSQFALETASELMERLLGPMSF